MSEHAARPDLATTALAVDPPDRHPHRLVAALLALFCVSACEATTVPGLNIRAAPTTASAVVGKMGNANTMVRIECSTRGEAVHGQTMWYRITQPDAGYITAYYIRKDSNTDATPAC